MFVLFVDVSVVRCDVLAVGDVLTLGCYAVFNEPVRRLLRGAGWDCPCKAERTVLKIETAMPGMPHIWQLPH